ncbi:MAG: hypothetical protein KatS3mg077_2126 [Candidatus Binatia bacterium]|nr:MAG: hypothetical protein KatS3mg015_3088 [Fimbriimonadales bacterium]GIW44844.1 MAG: hypothetical protein KatS3mg077_2126 [Candidatus Binatia bacterium]
MMARRLVTLGFVVLGSGLASGCALTVDRIRLDYTPQANVQKMEQADSVIVRVSVDDIRNRKDRVSSKKNSYEMEMAAIVAENDLTELVKYAVNSELQSWFSTRRRARDRKG